MRDANIVLDLIKHLQTAARMEVRVTAGQQRPRDHAQRPGLQSDAAQRDVTTDVTATAWRADARARGVWGIRDGGCD